MMTAAGAPTSSPSVYSGRLSGHLAWWHALIWANGCPCTAGV